ncbi:hypothetical protein SDJN03_21575, partial [Cucurbita argyrosperma subsp. sororia]
MNEDVFRRILVSRSFDDDDVYDRNMIILNGSIVLFYYLRRRDEREFDIWEMEKDECGGILWSKRLTIGPLFGIENPRVFVSSNELPVAEREC